MEIEFGLHTIEIIISPFLFMF